MSDEDVVAGALHQACLDTWAGMADSVSKYVTKHGAEAHLEAARRVLVALDKSDKHRALADTQSLGEELWEERDV